MTFTFFQMDVQAFCGSYIPQIEAHSPSQHFCPEGQSKSLLQSEHLQSVVRSQSHPSGQLLALHCSLQLLQSVRWEKSHTDDLREKVYSHFETLFKSLNLQSNSSFPTGQVIGSVKQGGHSIRHAPEGPHSQNRPQSEV